MFQRRLENKLLILLSGIFFIAFLLVIGFTLWQKERFISDHYQEMAKEAAYIIERVLHASMLAGQPEIAGMLIKDFLTLRGMYDLELARADGYAAFRDNKTIRAVNKHLGADLFKYRKEQEPERVFLPSDPVYKEARQEGQASYLREDSKGRGLVTLIVPIKKGAECYQCHSQQEEIRGVMRVSIGLEELQKNIYQARKWALITLVLSLSLSFLLIKGSLKRWLFNPIYHIVSVMEEVGRGNMSRRVLLTTKDELGDIGQAFNTMAGHLDASHTILEAKVVERTRSLQELSQQLEAQRSQLESLLDNLISGVIYLDPEGRILFSNRKGKDFLPLLTEPGQDGRLIHLGDKQIEGITAQIIRGQQQREELEVVSLRDPERIFQVAISPIKSLQEKILGAMVIIRDISEEKLLKGQLIQAEKLSLAGRLISEVAHELNNSLTIIMGQVEIQMVRGGLDEKNKKELQTILTQGERASRIVQRLFLFVRKQKPEKRYVDLNRLVESVLEMRQPAIAKNNIQLRKELDPSIPLIMADPHQLDAVFLNIINNALDEMIMSKGGGGLTVRSKSMGKTVRLSFEDTGRGIPPEIMGRIFDPFFTTKEGEKGTGLGLSISFGIVQEHGGIIYARSRQGEGSTFIVELPIQPPENYGVRS